MKRKRAEELGQYGYIISGSLFAILAIVGSLLENEFIITLAVLFLLYIPAYVIVIVIWEIRDSPKKRKKKKRKVERKDESGLLQCPKCKKVYNREELDLSPTATPFCPECDERLAPP